MKRLLTSCFGLGWLPIAPGTWGSLPPAIVWGVLAGFSVSGFVTTIVMAVLVIVGSAACVRFAPSAIEATSSKDPSEVVADEFAGQAVTFLPVVFLPLEHIWAVALCGFLLFRLFDIIKPWPIRKLEALPAGWGILCDDLLAGVYAGIVLTFCSRFIVPWIAGQL